MGILLQDLPTELIEHIVLQLDPKADTIRPAALDKRRRTTPLLALVLASRRLQTIVEPILYRSFSSYGNSGAVRPFLHVLCQRPQLADHVRTLTIFPFKVPDTAPTCDERANFQNAMAHFDTWPLHDSLLSALSTGCAAAEAVLTLLLSSKLQNLHLHPWSCTRHADMCSCPEMSECLSSFWAWSSMACDGHFMHLRSIKFAPILSNPESSKLIVPHDLACHFLQLPQLRHMVLDSLVSSPDPLPTSSQHSTLTYLFLQDYMGDHQSLASLLGRCKQLRSFNIRKKYTPNSLTDFPLEISFNGHASILRVLRLHDYEFRSSMLNGLHLVENLRHLEINTKLFSWLRRQPCSDLLPCLPPSLRYLSVYASSAYKVDELGSMLPKYLPHLPLELEHFAILYKMCRKSDRKYLGLIQDVYEERHGSVAKTAKVMMKDESDWIVTLGHQSRGVRFLCRKGKQAIKVTVSSVIESISSESLASLVGEYYSDWPPPSTSRTFKLQTIRMRDGGPRAR